MLSSSKKQQIPKDDSLTQSNQQRIEDLNKVLLGIQGSASKEEKNARRDYFFQRVKQLEDKIQKYQVNDNQKFKLLNDQVEKSEESLKVECEQRELIAEKCLKSLTLVEKNFTLQLNEEYQTRKQNEQEILTEIDDKIGQMKQEVRNDSQERREYELQQIDSIEKELEDLRFYFEKEKQIRDQTAESLIKGFGEEILRLQEFFSDERKKSESTYETTLKLLQDLDYSIQKDLDQEKKIREKSEKSMLRLLEETCQRIEQSLLAE